MSEHDDNDPVLSADLRRHARTKGFKLYVGDGWLDLVRDCHQEVADAFPDYELLAVKEKYGMLAFQAFPRAADWTLEELEVLDDIVERWADRSATVCERCGAAGQLRGRQHELTLCDRCHHELPDRRWRPPSDRR